MSAARKNKINKEELYSYLVDLIKQSPNKEAEISASDLADRYGVQAPTIDYHLSRLLDEGKLNLSPNRGKYNRKIYRLPVKENKKVTNTEVLTPEHTEKFKEFLKSYIQKAKDVQEFPEEKEEQKSGVQEELEFIEEIVEQPKEQIAEQVEKEPKTIREMIEQNKKLKETKSEEEISMVIAPAQETVPVVHFKDLTLDEQIESFLNAASQVHEASMLLKHEDREILSVMNETIRENMVFLKDLTEQLSTIQNKQLIMNLIDERNAHKEQIDRLENELEQVKKVLTETKEQYQVDPQRVRFMQQLIISTIDEYLNLPNHALALQRKQFRSKVTKELSDLVKYALGIEE